MTANLVEKTTGYYTAFDGTPIYYEVRGKGEPLVFVYGIACVINHWHHQIEFFSRTHKVIAFDIRGHHKSTPIKNTSNLTFEHLAFDLNGLLKHLSIEKAHFVGHSFGVPYLIKTYQQFPEIFKSLTFINGFSRNPLKKVMGLEFVEPFFYFMKEQHSKHPDLWKTLWKNFIDNPLAMQLAALSGGFNLKLTQFKDIEVYSRGVSRLDLPVFFTLFEELLKFDELSNISDISVPTLVIAGDRDFITPVSYQKELSDRIRGSQYELFPYGSHCTQLDFPDLFNYKFESFLKKI